MKFFLLVLISSTFLLSCTSLNRNSQDHYKAKKTFRHGLVPIPSSTTTKVPKDAFIKKVNPKTLAFGEKLYKDNCYRCHGVSAKGNGPESSKLSEKPANLLTIIDKVPNFKLYMMVSQWQGEMPGWKSLLSDKEISHVRNYILHLASKDSK